MALSNAITNCDGKLENLDALKNIETQLPGAVQLAAGLQKTCQGVRNLKRMARASTVAVFVGKVKDVVDKALKWKDEQQTLQRDAKLDCRSDAATDDDQQPDAKEKKQADEKIEG